MRDFRKSPITYQELTECRWYAMANDTIGGWDVATAPVPDSRRNAQKGEFEIGTFLTEEVAQYIAELHNKWWDAVVWKSYYVNIVASVYLEAYDNYYGDRALTGDDFFDYYDEHETT